MEKISKVVLSALSIILFIIQWVCVIGGILLVGGLISSIFSYSARIGLMDIFLSGSEVTKGMIRGVTPYQFVSVLIILFILAVIAQFFVLGSIRSLLQNLDENIFFDSRNLELIKKFVLAFLGYFLIEVVMSLAMNALLTKQFSVMQPNLFGDLLMIGGTYVVYLIFKRGLELKTENESFV